MFGMELNSLTLDTGSVYTLYEREKIRSRKNSAQTRGNLYTAITSKKSPDDIVTVYVEGVIFYYTNLDRFFTVITDHEADVFINKYSKYNSITTPDDSFGMSVYSEDGVTFTTSETMLTVNDFDFINGSGDLVLVRPKTYSSNVSMVAMDSLFHYLPKIGGIDISINSYRILGGTVSFYVTTERWTPSGDVSVVGRTSNSLLNGTLYSSQRFKFYE